MIAAPVVRYNTLATRLRFAIQVFGKTKAFNVADCVMTHSCGITTSPTSEISKNTISEDCDQFQIVLQLCGSRLQHTRKLSSHYDDMRRATVLPIMKQIPHTTIYCTVPGFHLFLSTHEFSLFGVSIQYIELLQLRVGNGCRLSDLSHHRSSFVTNCQVHQKTAINMRIKQSANTSSFEK